MFPEDPCYLLGKASRFIKCRIDSRLAEIGLTFSQYKIIATLYNENDAQGGPMTPADLADKACCERPTVTGIIDRLEKQGLVSRPTRTTGARRPSGLPTRHADCSRA
jgi:DNA-binding MarR family transcriptional regulator